MLAVSPDSVIRMWKAGELPGFRLSSKVLRFRRSEILATLEQLRNVTVEPAARLRALS